MSSRRNNGGFVLVFTLGFLVVMTAAALEFHRICAERMEKVRRDGEILRAEFLCRTGAALAARRLLRDTTKYDWIGDDWNKQTVIEIPEGGSISFTIFDESGKINLNGLIDKEGKESPKLEAVTKRLFTVTRHPGELADCLLDWVDENEMPRMFGAEGEYYGALVPPYRPADRNLYSLRELALIKGFTPEVLNGYTPPDPEQGEPVKGILDLVTVFSDSKINVNTCAPEILQALGFAETKVTELIRMREAKPLSESILMKTDKNAYLANRSLITIKSRFFSVVSEGVTAGGERRSMRVYLQRDKIVTVLRTEYL